jgi:hypothetical protein
LGCTSELVEAAVVFTVRVVVAVFPAASWTLEALKLQVGRLCAPVGELASAQVRLTVPE